MAANEPLATRQAAGDGHQPLRHEMILRQRRDQHNELFGLRLRHRRLRRHHRPPDVGGPLRGRGPQYRRFRWLSALSPARCSSPGTVWGIPLATITPPSATAVDPGLRGSPGSVNTLIWAELALSRFAR